jgi:hypothetical protein
MLEDLHLSPPPSPVPFPQNAHIPFSSVKTAFATTDGNQGQAVIGAPKNKNKKYS